MDKQVVVITGCDSGIGKSLCPLLAAQGYEVIASFLNDNPFPDTPHIRTKKMDITRSGDIEEFVHFIDVTCGSDMELVCLVNNAGIAKGGPIETIPMNIVREVFDINFFGLIELTQRLIPRLIAAKGKIVVLGSMAGKIAIPFLSPYAASKFALEGFCDSLRREMNPFGVQTVLLELGAIATPIWQKAEKQDLTFMQLKYIKSMGAFRENFVRPGNQGMDVGVCAAKIVKIIKKRKNKPRYIIAKNRLLTALELLLPDSVLDYLLGKMFKMDYGN